MKARGFNKIDRYAILSISHDCKQVHAIEVKEHKILLTMNKNDCPEIDSGMKGEN